MRSIIICEGQDDLWFLAYYINKSQQWNTCESQFWCTAYHLDAKENRHQHVIYMISPDSKNQVALFASGGQDQMKPLIKEWLQLNEKQPLFPIDSIIILRDCDNRCIDKLCHEMEIWFKDFSAWLPSDFSLQNNQLSTLQAEIDEIEITTYILPIIIPFDEAGAIETLLLKAIEDSNTEGAYIASSAKAYIESAKDQHLTHYLTKQRLITKAKLSAAIAITNPDHSTGNFKDLMMCTPWENSASIKTHMQKAILLISHQN